MDCPHKTVEHFADASVWALMIGVCTDCATVLHIPTLEKARKQFTPDGEYELVSPPKERVPDGS